MNLNDTLNQVPAGHLPVDIYSEFDFLINKLYLPLNLQYYTHGEVSE